MNRQRRTFLSSLAAGACSIGCPSLARAQQGAPLRILVGFAAGGGADMVARAVADGLRSSGRLGIVENKVGAGGRLATDAFMQAPADGNTLMFTPTGNLTLYPHIYTGLRYGPQSFAPLGTACDFDFALAVGPGSSAHDLQEFLAQAKADPKLAAYGTPGAGTAMHFLGAMLARESKVPLLHVPYKGASAALTDAMGGAVPAFVSTTPFMVPMHKAGKIRILGRSSAERSADLPDVPTFASLGYPDMVVSEYFGMFARKETPGELQAQLAADIRRAVDTPAVKAALDKQGFTPRTLKPQELQSRINADYERWRVAVQASGYKPEA